ncbi:MAG: IS1634 family transposase [Actinomycetota bacterium]|nr:IS1634 family transposase [Actinomycetota bacterium]
MRDATIERRHGDRIYTSHLVRRSVREGRRVRHETIANVSKLPPEAIEALRRALRGEAVLAPGERLAIENPLPAGHVEAALAMARRLELSRLIDRRPSKERELVLAMVVQRVLEPGSKLWMARALSRSTLGAELGLEGADQDDLYGALDWLLERQERIEDRLARRHLRDGELVLYDVSSAYFEGRSCPLVEFGHPRGGKRGTPQIVFGLLCDRSGRPLAVEVFPGSLHDDKTLPGQLDKLRRRFKLRRIVVVSDRGMVTKANLDAMRAQAGVFWITALKAPQVKRLVRDGQLQLSLFDQQNLAEISDEENYPGKRLVVCRNPLVAAERARKREDLLRATEAELAPIQARVEQGTLQGEAEIGLAVGAVWNRFRMRKHFEVEISDTRLGFERKQEQIEREAALDGIYVLRTSVPAETLESAEVVRSYKQLKEVERGFRTIKGPELELRPIHHRLEDRVRAHVFLCTLAYYLEWHLRQTWAELTFKDECPPISPDPVAKAQRSPEAERKARTKRTAAGQPCHSFRGLIAELARRTQNTVRIPGGEGAFTQLSEPTPLQARALELVRTAEIA